VLLGALIVNGASTALAESPMSGFFEFFALPPLTAAVALAFAIVLGAVAAFVPAWRASRLNVTNALRVVG
jgi:ABC-type antimicrobial peptide transport system permease subunit